jgi:hypothetical protein
MMKKRRKRIGKKEEEGRFGCTGERGKKMRKEKGVCSLRARMTVGRENIISRRGKEGRNGKKD